MLTSSAPRPQWFGITVNSHTDIMSVSLCSHYCEQLGLSIHVKKSISTYKIIHTHASQHTPTNNKGLAYTIDLSIASLQHHTKEEEHTFVYSGRIELESALLVPWGRWGEKLTSIAANWLSPLHYCWWCDVSQWEETAVMNTVLYEITSLEGVESTRCVWKWMWTKCGEIP